MNIQRTIFVTDQLHFSNFVFYKLSNSYEVLNNVKQT